MKSLLTLLFFLLISNLISAQEKDSLKVMSWNVFLRPGILKDEQLKRVDSISSALIRINADVVVLQEVFHKKSRKRLIAALSQSYPYHSKMGRKTFWGVPSGNCIFSKDSIFAQEHIYYKRAIKADKMAKKGAIMVQIEHRGKRFNIFGTHLQAGGGTDGAIVRSTQIDQLAELAKQQEETKAAIFAGDFNIRYGDELYGYIVNSLSIRNTEPADLEFGTSNLAGHTLTNVNGQPKWIDFILLKPDDTVDFRSSYIEEPKCFFNDQCERISDHNPIITLFEW